MKPTQAQIEAEQDASIFGIGFVRTLPGGTQERLDPGTIYMTKPTDRQIKAVEDVLRGLVVITGDSTWDFNYVAKAVLAAAAEVGETERDLHWEADMRAIKKWQAATGKTLIWPDHTDLCIWLMNELAATIERCAQVADNMAYVESCADDTMRGITNGDPYRKVATAIRELKDKP